MKQENCSLLSHNTFGIDVKAACLLEYSSVDELRELILQGLIVKPYLHIGGGSNLLFTKDYQFFIPSLMDWKFSMRMSRKYGYG